MATQVQVSDDGGTSWRDIDYSDFEITIGIHESHRVPTAQVTTRARESITPGQPFRIRIDGTTRFEGVTESGGTIGTTGQVTLRAQHEVAALFSDSVDVNRPNGETTAQILADARLNAENGTAFTITHDAPIISLDEYDVTDRKVQNIFADIMDRTGYVYWVDPVANEIFVQERRGRGTWQTLDSSDGVTVQRFDEGSVETVVNDVTVNVTKADGLQGTATDQTSINTYGRRTEEYNYEYTQTQTEADQLAQSLLRPTPLEEGKLNVPRTAGAVETPLVNYEIDYSDSSKGINATGLLIERQTIRQGQAELATGEGRAASLGDSNRRNRSENDETLPGYQIGTERIVDGSIANAKIEDLSISAEKIIDGAVEEAKVDFQAITETKIRDDSISTPKIKAAAITAGLIDADAVTTTALAAEAVTVGKFDPNAFSSGNFDIDQVNGVVITPGGVGAPEIAANSITADKIDVIDLNTGQLSIGTDADFLIEFDITQDNSGNDIPRILPTGDAASDLGSSTQRFRDAYIQNLQFFGGIMDPGTTDRLLFGAADNNEAIMYPSTDNTGQLGGDVGLTTRGFADVQSHNFTTLTPEPLDRVDLGKLKGFDWRNPPAYAAQKKGKDGEYKRRNPNRGVELGHMANYLLEVCKSQQEKIDQLEKRLSQLEQQV